MASSPLNPSAPEFIPASLFPPPEFTPAVRRHPHFSYPHVPPPPTLFFNDQLRCYPPVKKEKVWVKVFSHCDDKARKPNQPFPWSFCHRRVRRCLPPRLLKKKEKALVTKNQNSSAKRLPVEDNVKTFLAGKTSVMVKNIPNDFGRHDLLRILDSHCRNENQKGDAALGFCDDEEQNPSSYDFLYLPMDFVKRANLGYAFVNFTSSIAAVRFHREFDKFFWANQRTKKICEINTAKFQGKEELSQHFKESKFPCHTDEYLPVVLSPPSDGFTGYKLKTLGFRVGFRGGASRRA